ncbi:MAG: hypothetical protein ABR520_07920 [Mycobacteriales bacterium]
MTGARRTTYLAWGCWLFTLAGMSSYAVLTRLGGEDKGPLIEAVPIFTMFVVLASVGAVLASKRPRNAIGWLLSAIASGATLGNLTQVYADLAVSPKHAALPGAAWSAWFGLWLWPASMLLLLFVLLLFPDGRPPSPRWRPFVRAGVAGGVFLLAPNALRPGLLGDEAELPLQNPVGVRAATGVLKVMGALGVALLVTLFVTVVVSLIVRSRRSAGVERQQLKWLGFAGVCLIIGGPGVGLTADAFGAPWLSDVGFALGVAAVPVAIAVGVLRYRLYEIDSIINRTIVYAVLTATLGGVYLGMVLALQALLGAVTPSSANNGVAVAASTLAAAAAFQPARRRIQGFIDRRFYRRKYHAARTVEVFARGLRDEVDLETLSSNLLAVVRETMQPTALSLWLR